jgi:transcriptional regulator with XRE-family HTH domain
MSPEPEMLVQKLRLQRGWSQEQLAELAGLSVRTIQRIERGNTASVESLKALGAVFDVDFSTLKEPLMSPAEPKSVAADEALAMAHVRRIKRLYMHCLQYAVVIVFLTVVNLLTFPKYLWVIWVALGWGLALGLQALKAFDRIPFLSGDWEKRQVEKYLGRQL